MNNSKKTVLVDARVDFDIRLAETARSFINALQYVSALHHIQDTGDISHTLENITFRKMISTLMRGGENLPEEDSSDYEKSVKVMEEDGIYDLFSLDAGVSGKPVLNLIVGMIFSSRQDNPRAYGGAAGVINNSFDGLIESYDQRLDLFQEKLPVPDKYKGVSILDKTPSIRCLDVFSLAGELNVLHKPICVFFSGGGDENLSALPRMTVFINVYVKRFIHITKEIARKYMRDFLLLDELDSQTIGKLLLIWLRGHDLGHQFGLDSLSGKMDELDKDYMILHELKSDMISLFNLRRLTEDLLKGDMLNRAYALSVAEMFRYIRRGDFYKHPDTASAYLAYSYFRDRGSIYFNTRTKKFEIDFGKLEIDSKDMTEETLFIFAEGDVNRARELVNRWGDIENLESENLPVEIEVLNDTNIPHYIDFNFGEEII